MENGKAGGHGHREIGQLKKLGCREVGQVDRKFVCRKVGQLKGLATGSVGPL